MATNYQVAVIPGAGMVLREGDTIVFIEGQEAPDSALVARFRSVASSEATPERVREVARILLDEDSPPSVAVVTLTGNEASVFLYGAIDAVTGTERASGEGQVLGVTEQMSLAENGLTVLPTGEDAPDLPPWSSLGQGAVRGAGVVISAMEAGQSTPAPAAPPRRDEPAAPPPPSPVEAAEQPPPPDPSPVEAAERPPPPPPSPVEAAKPPPPPPPPDPPPFADAPTEAMRPIAAPDEIMEFESVPLAGESLGDRAPLPVEIAGNGEADAEPSAPSGPAYEQPVEVRGVYSPRGFFNHPEARYCSRSGVKMGASQTLVLINGHRPPLGVLTFDDGSTFAVQWNTVIGRDPTDDHRVKLGEAALLAVDDDTQSASRQHVLLELIEWDVTISDLGSQNGTFVRESAAAPEHRLSKGEQVVINSESVVRFGGRTFVYHAHHVQ